MTSSILELLQRLAAPLPGCTEADIQSDVRQLLTKADFFPDEVAGLEVPMSFEDGTNGRIDIEYGALVIECKKPSKLNPGKTRKDAEKQLAEYLTVREDESGQLYCGILTDGARWLHYRRIGEDDVELVSTMTVSPGVDNDRPFRMWLGSALPTEFQVKPTGVEIEGRLGAESPTHRVVAARLQDLLTEGATNPEVILKRELWEKLLRTAFGTQFEGSNELFVEHTYLVILATLIAREVLKLPPGDSPSVLLSGESFTGVGLTGIGEAGFFDWLLGVEDGEDVVRDLVRRVRCFDWSTVDHDVLKVLYQSVLSPEVRHKLGEYYTPDWLAERMIEVAIADPLRQRVLDPSCGSGTFLFAAITHYFNAADRAGLDQAQAVDELPNCIAGIDIHPVAVALAQVTYVLAVGLDRLSKRTRGFGVPVYLGDSLRWEDPALNEAQILHAGDDIVVHTTDGAELFATELRFPSEVAARTDFDSLVNDLIQKATSRTPEAPHGSISGILNRYSTSPSVRETLESTYGKLCSLHDEGRDHIWGYYVRNQARPAWFARIENRVDILIGNPPWLSYRYMPKTMQERFKAQSKARNLWSGGRVATHQDLSAFFVVRAVELYLREGGSFTFVTPDAVLTRQSYEGFRTGHWSAGKDGPNLLAHFATPWTLDGVNPSPFPVPSAVIAGRRSMDSKETAMPAVAELLSGQAPRSGGWKSSQGNFAISEVKKTANTGDLALRSPYADRFRNGATLFPRFLMMVDEGPPQPLAQSNQVSLVSKRTSLEKPPWKNLPGLAGVVERQFVFDVLLGDSIVPFAVAQPSKMVVPWSKTEGLLEGSDQRIDQYPGLAQWWRAAEAVWDSNKTASSKMSLLSQIDYMHKLEVQFPQPPLRVVYTASGNTLAASVVRDPRAVIEHKLYWAAVSSEDEGRFLSAILNAPIYTEMVRPYQSTGAFGPRDFDTYVWMPPVPVYERDNREHDGLVELGKQAEAMALAVANPNTGRFQDHRAAVRRALEEAGLSEQLNSAVSSLLSKALDGRRT